MKQPKSNTVYFSPIDIKQQLDDRGFSFLHIDYRCLMAGGEFMDRTDAATKAQNDRQMFNYVEAYNGLMADCQTQKHKILPVVQEFFKYPEKSPDYDFVVHGWNAMTVSIPQQILVLQQLYLTIREAEPLTSHQRTRFHEMAAILDEFFGSSFNHPETQAVYYFAKLVTNFEFTGHRAVDTQWTEAYRHYRQHYTVTLAEAILHHTDLLFD
jgi:hypothetical protein